MTKNRTRRFQKHLRSELDFEDGAQSWLGEEVQVVPESKTRRLPKKAYVSDFGSLVGCSRWNCERLEPIPDPFYTYHLFWWSDAFHFSIELCLNCFAYFEALKHTIIDGNAAGTHSQRMKVF